MNWWRDPTRIIAAMSRCRLDGMRHPMTRYLVVLPVLCVSFAASAVPLEELDFKHGIAFFHDLKYPADFTHFDYLNPDAPKGGKLVLAHPFSFDTLAPLAQGETGAPSGYLYRGDTLIVRGGDEITAFYGRLADGIAVADERTIVFRIHPQATWDDGVPITADDVVFTFEMRKNELGAGYFFRFIESVEALDERHVVFRIDAPLTHDHVTLIQYIAILPQHYWRDRDPSAHTLEPPVSSGPYRIKEVRAGRYIEYERNLRYWGRDLPINAGRYNFDTVRYEVYRDSTVAREAFRKGLIDMLDEDDIRYWVTGYEGSDLESGRIRKTRREYGISVGIGIAIVLNSQVSRLADRRVRNALALALNYEWINEKLYHGQRTRALSYWPGTILSATGLPSEDEISLLSRFRDALPSALFERPFGYPKTASPTASKGNLLEARDLLAASGWRIDDGALRDAGGAPFTLELLTLDPDHTRILLPWSAALRQLGIEVRIRLVDVSQYTNRTRHREYEALVQGYGILMPPTLELRSHFHSTSTAREGSRNVVGVSDPVVDFLVEKAEAAETLDQVIAACRALDRVLLWEHYLIPLYAIDQRRTLHWDKFGRPPEPLYRPAYPDGWWYDESKAARLDRER